MKYVSRFHGSRVGGFSLIEMLAVIALIGLIASVVAPNVLGKLAGGKFKATRAKVAATSSKVELYVLDVGSLPERMEDLVSKPGNAENWNGPYAKESDLKDAWEMPFVLTVPGAHGEFDLVSLGADKQPGGEGNNKDIGNWE
ncbi:MAG: type II secretion system protein GspG [Lysobacterales bacterium CG02_land_8_20_14_3_00_62_12]|nr:MAG: type II secretion system protein GspG [Xanthomonadales bacterium CG02_land_8_20_14_3_00_62_12]PJA42378.1 MAG: type II secretion system protein GspG [Xanthomonadales bacterium CG_4_9_14_3_um_filter_62_6]